MEQNGLNFCKDTVSRNSLIENKLINTLMFHGKKKASKRLLSVLYKNISKKTKKKIVSILICSLLNCLPILSVKTLRNKNRKKTSHRYIPFFIKKNYRTRSAIKVLFKTTCNLQTFYLQKRFYMPRLYFLNLYYQTYSNLKNGYIKPQIVTTLFFLSDVYSIKLL